MMLSSPPLIIIFRSELSGDAVDVTHSTEAMCSLCLTIKLSHLGLSGDGREDWHLIRRMSVADCKSQTITLRSSDPVTSQRLSDVTCRQVTGRL